MFSSFRVMPWSSLPAKRLISLYQKISFQQQEISCLSADSDDSFESGISKRLIVIKFAHQAIAEVNSILNSNCNIQEIERNIGMSYDEINDKISFFYYVRAENTFQLLKQFQLIPDNSQIFSEKIIKILGRLRAQNFNKEISDLALLQRIERDAHEALCFDRTKSYRGWYQNIASHALGNPSNILVKYSEKGFFKKNVTLQHVSSQPPDFSSCFGFRR